MIMFKKTVLLFLLSLIMCSTSFGQKKKDNYKKIEVVLGIDFPIKLDFNPSTTVNIGNPNVMNYEIIPSRREIILKGVKKGNSTVIIRDTTGEPKGMFLVSVRATAKSKIVKELKEFLGDIEGLEIGIKGDHVFVGGNIIVPSDIGKVMTILERYGEDIIQLVELSPHTQRIIARKMQDEMHHGGLDNVTVRIVNQIFWLEGVVNSDGERTRAQQIAEAYLPDRIESLARQQKRVETPEKSVIQNFISVNAKKRPEPIPKLVRITAQFVELTKDYNRFFGFKWSPSLSGDGGSVKVLKSGGGGITTQSDNTITGTIFNLFPKLASAKSAGYARIIQSGMILVKDGIQGELKKKINTKFALGTNEFTKADSVDSGYELKVTPRVLENEQVDLRLAFSVSSITGSPPEQLKNEVSTAIVVKNGESAVLGGVVINKTKTDFDKNPPGGEDQAQTDSQDPNAVPSQILFSFVRSKSYLTNRSQFVVFVTPQIVESASVGTEDIKKKFRKRIR